MFLKKDEITYKDFIQNAEDAREAEEHSESDHNYLFSLVMRAI